jgi:small subunit ribosomal protein S8
MQDPIADMLTRIRNAQKVMKRDVAMPLSKQKLAISQLLLEEGYISGVRTENHENKPTLVIELKYCEGHPVIDDIQRVSRPSARVYRSKDNLPTVAGGLGVAIVSTSKGLMTDRVARTQGLGGEVVFVVS